MGKKIDANALLLRPKWKPIRTRKINAVAVASTGSRVIVRLTDGSYGIEARGRRNNRFGINERLTLSYFRTLARLGEFTPAEERALEQHEAELESEQSRRDDEEALRCLALKYLFRAPRKLVRRGR